MQFTPVHKLFSITIIFVALLGFVQTAAADTNMPLGQWQHYTTEDGLVGTSVVAMAHGQDGLWATTYSGANRFDGHHWTPYTVEMGLGGLVQTVAVQVDGTAWFGYFGGGVARFDGTEWQQFGLADGLASFNVSAIAVNAQGKVWAGHQPFGTMAQGGGLSYFDGAQWTAVYQIPGLESNAINDLVFDNNGHLWVAVGSVATYSSVREGGVAHFDGTNWTIYTMSDGLVSNNVQALAWQNGHLWVGTDSGLSQFAPATNSWTTYDIANSGLVGNQVQSIAASNDGLWIGTNQGASWFDGTVWQMVTAQDGLLNNNVYVIEVDDAGQIWFGTDAGVSMLDLSTIHMTSEVTGQNIPPIAKGR